jgi:hypothetical protein
VKRWAAQRNIEPFPIQVEPLIGGNATHVDFPMGRRKREIEWPLNIRQTAWS